jgi:hypothetical protein
MAAIFPLLPAMSTVNNSSGPHVSCIRRAACVKSPRKALLRTFLTPAGNDLDSKLITSTSLRKNLAAGANADDLRGTAKG